MSMTEDISNVNPPKWANRFLEWYCADDLLDEIQGDLLEAFYYRKEDVGLRKAKWWFIWDVLRFFRPSSFKSKSKNSNQLIMFKHNVKIALRIIARKKWSSFVNIISLTLGITAVTLIFLFVSDELSYDNFHQKKENIYRLITDRYSPDGAYDYTDAGHQLPLAAQLKTDFSEVKGITRIAKSERYLRSGSNSQEEKVLLADSEFFKLFTFPLLLGNPETALEFSKNVVVSEDLAKRYFKSIDVIGKTLEIRQDEVYTQYQITGVVKNAPSNSTFQFDLIMNYDQVGYYSWASNYWGVRIDEVYMLLNENVDVVAFNDKVKHHWKNYLKSEVAESKEYEGEYMNYRVQQLEDVHMAADVSSSFSTGDPMDSYILSVIAVVILLIGCANFTILSIGRSALRGKEVAIKKVVGVKRKQLITQFWVEALTMSGFAMLLSVVLIVALLPTFNGLAEKNFQASDLLDVQLVVLLPIVTIVTGVIAGVYPAIVLSGVRALEFFKKKIRLGGVNLFTKSLITVQFSLSVMLLLGTVVVFQQIDFFRTKSLGYDNSNVIVLENTLNAEPEKLEVFKNVLASNPKIEAVSGISNSFGRGGFGSFYDLPDGTELSYSVYYVEPSFFDVLKIDIQSGRNFNTKLAADSNSVVVNQKFMKGIEKHFQLNDNLTDFRNAGLANPKVIGVSGDFHFQSLSSKLKPVMLLTSKSKKAFSNVLIKASEAPNSELLSYLEDTWYEIAPDSPFNYAFMNEDIEAQYKTEQRWFAIVKSATFWALGLATLGLLGIVSMSITGRLKELSIRKVLGAGAIHLYYIMGRQFLLLLIIASIIAIPITVHFADDWLNGFAYHIDLNPLTFVGVILLIVVLIITIVFVGTSKAIRNNPVSSLRME